MASYNLIQHAKPWVESPAKIFAKLKSKVQREEISKERTYNNAAIGPLYTGQHAAHFMSPKKRPERTYVNDDCKENQRFGPYRNEAQVSTLSPIPSPQKTSRDSYLDIGSKPWDDECSPKKRAFLESTAMSHPLSLYNRTTQIHSEPPQIGHQDEFMVTSSKTPVKLQPEQGECQADKLEYQASMYSPMRKRLRRTTLETRYFNTLSSCTNKVSVSVFRMPQERKASGAFSEDDTETNPSMEDLCDVRGAPGDRQGMNKFFHEPMLPPRLTADKGCRIHLENIPQMSPAKMFAYMKQRESKVEQQDVHEVSSCTRDLFDNGNSHLSRDRHPSTAHNVGLIHALRDPPGNVAPVDKSREESADSQSDTDPSENVQILAEPTHPVSFEDPLVLNTPRIAIPKKLSAVLKRNKWPQVSKFPSESVIYLKKWFLRKNYKGLFVDGIHGDDNIPWNSNIIVNRVSNSVLKTVSGRVYILVGKMNLKEDSEFPNWLLKKFVNGFPVNWKALYEKFLSENDRETARDGKGTSVKSKAKSGASSVNHSEKQRKQKPLRTPASCPLAPSHSIQVSRSGRTIKPPLEYWKGGRVLLDAHMNVTIHECYETTICIPEVTTTVSARKSKNPSRVFLSSGEGHDGCESTTDQEEPAPLRRVKPQRRKSNRAKVSSEGKPAPSLEPPVEILNSRDKSSCRTTRSSGRNAPTEERLSTKQTEPEKSSKNSKKQTHKPPTPPLRVSRRKKAVSSSPESPPFNDSSQASDDEVPCRRVKKEKAIHKTRGKRVVNESRYSSRFPSSSSSEESPGEIKSTKVTRTRDTAQTQRKPKEGRSTKVSPPTKPLPKATQPKKKKKAKKSNTLTPQDEDGDEWTEMELMKLQEAVSYFPKHIEGYWTKVARMVGTRSTEECHRQHMSQGNPQTPATKPSKSTKQRVEAPKDPDLPLISARAGTLRRKKEVRQFLEAMPKEDVRDVFTSAYMQKKWFEVPSMCSIDDHDFAQSEPQTPGSAAFPEVKTPRCLYITPGMTGSPNKTNDKHAFQLEKRMSKKQFNVCKQAPSSKSFTPTPSVKRTMRRCGNTDTFVVWEMFPGNDAAQSDSGEEEDFYFSDND